MASSNQFTTGTKHAEVSRWHGSFTMIDSDDELDLEW